MVNCLCKPPGDNSPAPSEEGEVVSQEQLRFTAAISKAMSKQLAPLLAGRDPTQTRPNVYRGSKEGSIDCWILVMRRYLQRNQAKATPDDKAWSIIGHLEGEARNYIINKAESERATPEKVFDLLAKASLVGPSQLNVMKFCSVLSKAFVTHPCGGSSPLSMRPNPRSPSLPLSNHCDLQHGNCSVLDQGRRPMTLDMP